MNERPFGHTPGHSRHDRLLVARFTVGESLPGEAEEGRRLLEQCTDCARLAADLRLLRTSVAALPTPARTRNFRLTAEQAERLRGNTLERLLRRLAMPGLTMLRPVAGVAMAIGLTIMVVGAGLPMSAPVQDERLGVSAGAPTSQGPKASQPAPVVASPGRQEGETYEVTGPAASNMPPELTDSGSDIGSAENPTDRAPSTDDDVIVPTPTEQAVVGPTTNLPTEPPADTTRLLLIYGGTTLAMLSFGLLLLAWFARRRLEDPLLR